MKHVIKAVGVASVALSIAGNVQADTTIYGKGHISYDVVDYGKDNDGSGLASNSSRLGIKGDVNLTDGIKGIYQFESGVDVSGRSGSDGNGGEPRDGQLFTQARDSFVGLSGQYGTIMGGRLGVVNQWLYDVDLFADQVGDLGNFWGMTNGLPGRADGVLAYASPSFKGLDFILAYKGDETNKETDAMVAKVNFALKGLKLGLGYSNLGQGKGNRDTSVYAVTGSYDAKVVQLVAGYQSVDNYNKTHNSQSSWTAGLAVPVKKMTFKAQYMTLTEDDLSDSDSTGYAVGLDYALSNNATVYAAYSYTSNEDNATAPADSWGHGNIGAVTADGSDPSAFSLGLIVDFSAKVF